MYQDSSYFKVEWSHGCGTMDPNPVMTKLMERRNVNWLICVHKTLQDHLDRALERPTIVH